MTCLFAMILCSSRIVLQYEAFIFNFPILKDLTENKEKVDASSL